VPLLGTQQNKKIKHKNKRHEIKFWQPLIPLGFQVWFFFSFHHTSILLYTTCALF
jgi:hypothetical protein